MKLMNSFVKNNHSLIFCFIYKSSENEDNHLNLKNLLDIVFVSNFKIIKQNKTS
jgi:hypothetical protein